MYFLIDTEKNQKNRHYELMPDGRAIVSGREARMLGTIEGATVVMDAATLERMRASMKGNADAAEQNFQETEEKVENTEAENTEEIEKNGRNRR